MEFYSFIISIFLAIGLSAACGFRIFIPPLSYGLLYRADLVQLEEGWNWIGNEWVLAVLALASIVEICANLIPWLDNLLDVLATPTSIAAGTVLSSSCLVSFDPGLQWMLSVMSGVLITGGFQFATVGIRGLSSVFTGGCFNPIFSIIEDLISIGITLSIILFPIIGIIIIILIAFLIWRLYLIMMRRKRVLRTENIENEKFRKS